MKDLLPSGQLVLLSKDPGRKGVFYWTGKWDDDGNKIFQTGAEGAATFTGLVCDKRNERIVSTDAVNHYHKMVFSKNYIMSMFWRDPTMRL